MPVSITTSVGAFRSVETVYFSPGKILYYDLLVQTIWTFEMLRLMKFHEQTILAAMAELFELVIECIQRGLLEFHFN
jgi:hypothetical protein